MRERLHAAVHLQKGADAAELHRVFPFHAIGENGKMNHHATGAQTETAILEARIAVLKDMAELLRE